MTENENIEQTQEIIYSEECDRLVEDALNLTGEESLNKFFDIINLYPDCDYAYIMVGCNYRENLKYKKAIPYFEKAIEVNNIYTGLAYAELGFCYEMLGNLKKAEDCYKKSIEINPENPIAKYYWADYLVHKEGDYYQAEPIAKSLVNEYPDTVDYHRLYADVLCGLEKIQEANEEYKKALELDNEDDTTLNNYGTFLLQNGEPESAKKYFIKAIELNPDYALYKENLYQAIKMSTKYYKLKMKYKNKFLKPIVDKIVKPHVDKMVILTFILALWFPVVKNTLKYTARYAENSGNMLLYKSAIIAMWVVLLILFALAICDFITFVLIKLKIIK